MGECLIVRRGGESYELPVLSASYPKDVTVTAAAGASASFSISITTPGRPAEYTYQWYRNGAAVSGGTAASLTLTGLTAAATYSVYCKVTNKAGSVNSRVATLTVLSYLPTYTYSGSSKLIDDGNFNWRLKLLTSGNLTFSHLGSAGSNVVDVFLVGGGGGGATGGGGNGGGGGGYTLTNKSTTISKGASYSIIIGAGGAAGTSWPNRDGKEGGATKVTELGLAVGGGRGGSSEWNGGAGGSGGGAAYGGAGGSNGSNGTNSNGVGGYGQGTTTREFGDPSGDLYAGGGGAGHAGDRNTQYGGDGGGGNGNMEGTVGTLATPGVKNTGGGGGGGFYLQENESRGGRAGGSGIVIIRNTR